MSEKQRPIFFFDLSIFLYYCYFALGSPFCIYTGSGVYVDNFLHAVMCAALHKELALQIVQVWFR